MKKYYTPSDEIEIMFEPLPHIDDRLSLYEGFKPGSTVLPKGMVCREGYSPLPCDIFQERDVDFTLSDGTTIYMDVFRPLTDKKVPVILAWGPAGKGGIRDMLDGRIERKYVPRSALSGLQGWECADPMHWVPHGYAVVEVDPRGCFMSEGDVQYFGDLDASDAYECIEWLSGLEWCNGKIGLSGCSWYAMVQLYIAAKNPPHLAAIAPWEGQDDLYREEYVKGGIPMGSFPGARCWSNGSRIEAICEMARHYPLFNEYWAGKRPQVEDIKMPVYMVASYTNGTHTCGTFDAWRRLTADKKWLRIHNSGEWPDYYSREGLDDLRRFFDRYLKDIDNSWEDTPVVRMTTLDQGGTDLDYRTAEKFPPDYREVCTVYLDAKNASMSEERRPAASVSYDSESREDEASFLLKMDEELEITGYCKLKLWVEADGSDDMDLYVRMAKRGADGSYLFHDAVGGLFYGPYNQLRVSHRELDPEKSTELIPFHTHTSEQLLASGEIVPVEIMLSPISMLVHPGEHLEIMVSGFNKSMARKDWKPRPEDMRLAMLQMGVDPDKGMAPPPNTSRNKGRHIIHTGGEYDSLLMFPAQPTRAQDMEL